MELEYEDDFDRYSDDFDDDEDDGPPPGAAAPGGGGAPPDPARLARMQSLPLAMGPPLLLYQQRPMSQEDRYIEGLCREQSVATSSQFVSRGTSTYMEPASADASCQAPGFTGPRGQRASAEYFSGLFEAVFGGGGDAAGPGAMGRGPGGGAAKPGAAGGTGEGRDRHGQGGARKTAEREDARAASEPEAAQRAASWCKANLALFLSGATPDTDAAVLPLRALRCGGAFFVSLGVALAAEEVVPVDDPGLEEAATFAETPATDLPGAVGRYPLTRTRRKQALHGFFDRRGRALAVYANEMEVTCVADRACTVYDSSFRSSQTFVACGTDSGLLQLLPEPGAARDGSQPPGPPPPVRSLVSPLRASAALPRRTLSPALSVAQASGDGQRFATIHRGGELLLWQLDWASGRLSASALLEAGRPVPFAKAPERVYHVMLGTPAVPAGACLLRDGTLVLFRDWRALPDVISGEGPGSLAGSPEGSRDAGARDAAPEQEVAVCPPSSGRTVFRVSTVTETREGDVVPTGYAVVAYEGGLVCVYASVSACPVCTLLAGPKGLDVLMGELPEGVLRALGGGALPAAEAKRSKSGEKPREKPRDKPKEQPQEKRE